MMKTFSQIAYENFNVNDRETLRVLTTVNEQDQGQILQSLTSKLYDVIVKKVDDIDYGSIPSTRGDITKLQNYDELVDCCDLIKEIVSHYGQPTVSIQIIIDAINNIKIRTSLWEKGYQFNMQFPCITYETMVLAVVTSISFMITTCIEYIKSSDNKTFEVALDKVAYTKTRDNLLLRNLDAFNKACAKGEVDKAIEYIFNTSKKGLLGTASVGMGIVAFTIIIVSILPFIRELIYFFYLTRQNIADYFEVQADLLQMNAANVQYKDMDDNQKEKIITKQNKIADAFRRISNVFAIKFKKAENDTVREINADKQKYKIDDVVDEMPDSASPASIF